MSNFKCKKNNLCTKVKVGACAMEVGPTVFIVFMFLGYYAEKNAIIVFAACFLPDSDCDNYNYLMENLFL